MKYTSFSNRLAVGFGGLAEDCASAPQTSLAGRIPVYPGQLNTWTIFYTGPRLDATQLRKHISYLFNEVWFSREKREPVAGIDLGFAGLVDVMTYTSEDMHARFSAPADQSAGEMMFRWNAEQQKYGGDAVWKRENLDFQMSPRFVSDKLASEKANLSAAVVKFMYYGSSNVYPSLTYRGMPLGGPDPNNNLWACSKQVNTWVNMALPPKEMDACEIAHEYSKAKIYTSPTTYVTSDSKKCKLEPLKLVGGNEGMSMTSKLLWTAGAVSAAGVGLYAWNRTKAAKKKGRG